MKINKPTKLPTLTLENYEEKLSHFLCESKLGFSEEEIKLILNRNNLQYIDFLQELIVRRGYFVLDDNKIYSKKRVIECIKNLL
jgi:hypothetical protein